MRDKFFFKVIFFLIINICHVIMSRAMLYMYHQYKVGFMLTGALTHETIFFFFIRDYYLEQNEDKQSREQEKKKKPSNTKLNCINQK